MDRTDEEIARDMLERRLVKVAARLRHLANEVESNIGRTSRVGQGSPAPSSYAVIVSDVQHEILSILPNLMLSELTVAALDADAARIAREHGKEA